ncbi:MAG: glycerol-3-phosphate 1-O-acyltransferase PlsY [Betaproteobacteria bacterium]
MTPVYLLLATVAAYLIGSLSFAVIVSRLMGLNDPRSYGSKNPGATNVLRSGNKAAAVLTLLLDAVKGWLPVAWVQWYGAAYGLDDAAVALVGLAAFSGHLFPVFFRFAGGKGVATAAGVLFGVHWALGLTVLLSWLLVAYFSRYSSLSALISALAAPLVYWVGDRGLWYADRWVALMLVIMSALLIWRHRQNIAKLLAGQESKIGAKG